MRPAVRLAALMELPSIFVWTHDSIGLGEDGPTHQPVEHLAALRAIPGLDVVRPADANETAWAWRTVLEHIDRPAGLALTRQNLPILERGDGAADGRTLAAADGRRPRGVRPGRGRGRRTRRAPARPPARRCSWRSRRASRSQADGIATRVVSMPCREWFDAQDADYRESVLPPSVRARVSVEAGVAMGWRELVGDAGRIVASSTSARRPTTRRCSREFGITAEAVVAAARDSLAAAASGRSPRRRRPHRAAAPATSSPDGSESRTVPQQHMPSNPSTLHPKEFRCQPMTDSPPTDLPR